MSLRKQAPWSLGAAAIGIVAASTLAPAFSPLMRSFEDNWSSSSQLGPLSSNEGIYVDMHDFSIHKGVAKGDPAAQIAKLGAKKVSDGAIIFRSGDALYIVDSKPPTTTQ